VPAPEAEARVLVELEEIVNRYRAQGQSAAAEHTTGSDAARLARTVYRARRARVQCFGSDSDLFGEPAWDILLDLFAAASEGSRISVSSACIAAAVPATTALRWLAALEARDLIERTSDPGDGRRCYLALTDAARRSMELWLARYRNS